MCGGDVVAAVYQDACLNSSAVLALDKYPFARSNKSLPLAFLAIAAPPYEYAAIISSMN
jgi:hypothetical protein